MIGSSAELTRLCSLGRVSVCCKRIMHLSQQANNVCLVQGGGREGMLRRCGMRKGDRAIDE